METAFSVISPQQMQVIQALNTYRFLTVAQMLRLGISKNAKSLREKTLYALRHQKLIQSISLRTFGLPDVHHLTWRGARLLEVEKADIVNPVPPAKKRQFSAAFAHHRFAQVDFQIGFHQWLDARGDADILMEHQDFVPCPNSTSRRFVSATQLNIPGRSKPIIPDGSFGVTLNNGKSVVYLVEVHRSMQTNMVVEQLLRYVPVSRSKVIEQKYGTDAHVFVCSVHAQESVCKATKSRLIKDPDFMPFRNHFVFQSLAALKAHFTAGWHFADGSPADPFPPIAS